MKQAESRERTGMSQPKLLFVRFRVGLVLAGNQS
jgi:hypothetical protein